MKACNCRLSLYPWAKNSLYEITLAGLNEQIRDFTEWISVTEDLVDTVEQLVLELWPSATVEIIGSSKTDLCVPLSDVDLVIFGVAHVNDQGESTSDEQHPPIELLYKLAKHLEPLAEHSIVEVFNTAKVPIIKMRDGFSGIEVDISFGVTTGRENTALVQKFCDLFPSLKPLTLVIKFYLKQLALNNSWSGGLGSYTVVILVIAYLQMQKGKNSISDSNHLATLLLGFFRYFGSEFDYTDSVISILDDGKVLRKADKLWENEKTPELLAVEDPNNVALDIGKHAFQISLVKEAFWKAYLSLSSPLDTSVAQPSACSNRLNFAKSHRDHTSITKFSPKSSRDVWSSCGVMSSTTQPQGFEIGDVIDQYQPRHQIPVYSTQLVPEFADDSPFDPNYVTSAILPTPLASHFNPLFKHANQGPILFPIGSVLAHSPPATVQGFHEQPIAFITDSQYSNPYFLARQAYESTNDFPSLDETLLILNPDNSFRCDTNSLTSATYVPPYLISPRNAISGSSRQQRHLTSGSVHDASSPPPRGKKSGKSSSSRSKTSAESPPNSAKLSPNTSRPASTSSSGNLSKSNNNKSKTPLSSSSPVLTRSGYSSPERLSRKYTNDTTNHSRVSSANSKASLSSSHDSISALSNTLSCPWTINNNNSASSSSRSSSPSRSTSNSPSNSTCRNYSPNRSRSLSSSASSSLSNSVEKMKKGKMKNLSKNSGRVSPTPSITVDYRLIIPDENDCAPFDFHLHHPDRDVLFWPDIGGTNDKITSTSDASKKDSLSDSKRGKKSKSKEKLKSSNHGHSQSGGGGGGGGNTVHNADNNNSNSNNNNRQRDRSSSSSRHSHHGTSNNLSNSQRGRGSTDKLKHKDSISTSPLAISTSSKLQQLSTSPKSISFTSDEDFPALK